MIECEATIKKWGNSLGIILPRMILKKNKFFPHDKVKVIITRIDQKNAAQKLWGVLPKWKTSSEDLERFVDKECDLPL